MKRTSAEASKRKNYRSKQSMLDAAQRILGTATETETIERALALVVFRERLVDGIRSVHGLEWHDVAGEMESLEDRER